MTESMAHQLSVVRGLCQLRASVILPNSTNNATADALHVFFPDPAVPPPLVAYSPYLPDSTIHMPYFYAPALATEVAFGGLAPWGRRLLAGGLTPPCFPNPLKCAYDYFDHQITTGAEGAASLITATCNQIKQLPRDEQCRVCKTGPGTDYQKFQELEAQIADCKKPGGAVCLGPGRRPGGRRHMSG